MRVSMQDQWFKDYKIQNSGKIGEGTKEDKKITATATFPKLIKLLIA